MSGYYDECYATGHTAETMYEDEEGYDWQCMVCGAEGWEDWEDEALDYQTRVG
jgi:hypothetical protein